MQTFINNRYRVIEELGKGGMGTVYLVEDALQDNRRMALKTIRADLLLERNLTQFKYEFSALGQLRHPNLVEVYDFGVMANSNEYFFTMEYVPGEELPVHAEEYLAASSNDYTWLFDVTVQICRVLQYIHSRGFIHYDVKPRNVRLTPEGTVKLMDFGLVGEVRGAGQLKVRGTPEYIAPELIRGGRIDHRIDLYSLGVSLYELVTGHPPFTGKSSLIVLRQHVENTPEPPRHFVHDLPETLQTLILKLMAKEPINRYTSAEAVIQAINQLTGSDYPVETKETKRGYIQSGDFVGRSFEIARLQGLLMRMMQGQGRLVLITGAAGVGKTRLVRELRLSAQMQRVLVCEGICHAQGSAPYHAWIPILSQVISYQKATKSKLLQKHEESLVSLMPELAEFVQLGETANELGLSTIPPWYEGEETSESGELSAPISEEDVIKNATPVSKLENFNKLFKINQADDSQRLMEAVLAFLLASNRPLVVILEDLHHADVETVELLSYLSQHADRGRWLLCGVYRETEVTASHPLNPLIEQAELVSPRTTLPSEPISRQPKSQRYELIRLEALTKADCAELVKSMLGFENLPTRLLDRLMVETGGNPLFIESLMQSLIEEDLLRYDGEKWHTDLGKLSRIPASIQEAALRRLKRLDSNSLDLLQWASVMGQWLDLNILAEVCEITPDQVFRIVAGAANQHVLTVNNQLGQAAYHFSTDQMREAIYNTLRSEALTARHWRIGQAFRKLYGDSDNTELLAWHFEKAQDWKLALHYTKLTADKARQVYANESAVASYTKALTLLEDHPELEDAALEYEILAGREVCYRLLGNRQGQQADIDRMIQIARSFGDAPKHILGLTRQVSLANLLGDYVAAKRAAATAMTLTYQLDDHQLEAQTLNSLGAACLRLGEIDRAEASHEHALQLYQDADQEDSTNRLGEATSLWHLGNVAQARHDPEIAQEYFVQALVIYQEIGFRRGEANVLNAFASLSDNAAERLRYHQKALDILVTIGDRDAQARVYYDLGVIYKHLGVYDRARHALEQALNLERELKRQANLLDCFKNLGQVYLALEEFDLAQQLFEEGYTLTRQKEDARLIAIYQMLLGELALARDRIDAAYERLQRASSALRDLDETILLVTGLALLGQTCLELGDTAAAHRATSEAVARLEALENTATGEQDALEEAKSLYPKYPVQRVWWVHYQVLQKVYEWTEGEPLSDEAWAYLHRAHDTVMATIINLDDKKLQHSYLTSVKINREIVSEWVGRSSRFLQIDEELPSEIQPSKGTLLDQVEGKLKRILDMGVQMSETHDIDLLLNYVLDQVMDLTAAERSFLALVDRTGQLNFKVSREMGHVKLDPLDFEETEESPARLDLSYTIIGAVAQTRSPILLNDAMEDPRFGRQSSVLELRLRSVLCIPLVARSNLVGLIYADSRALTGCFSQDDLDVVTIFANQAAIAIENTQLYQETLRANKTLEAWTHTLEQRVEKRTAELQQANLALLDRALQLQISSQVAQQVASILDLDDLLTQVVDVIQTTSGYYFVGIWLPVPRQDILTLRAGAGKTGRDLQATNFQVALDDAKLICQAYKTGENQIVENVSDSTVTPFIEIPDTHAELAFPLRVSQTAEVHPTDSRNNPPPTWQDVVGVLNIHSNQPTRFGDEEKMVLQLLANQIASAIRNAQLYEAETRRRQLAEALEQAGRALSSNLDLQEVPRRILEELARVVPYTRSIVLLKQNSELVSEAKHGFPYHDQTEPLRIPIEPGDIFDRLVNTKQPIVLDDVTKEPAWRQLPWLPVNRSWMGVPLITKGSVKGMLSLTRPDAAAFNPDEVSIAMSFAAQAAISLENASLYAEITELNETLEQNVRDRTQELKKAYRSMEQLNKTKTDFIRVAAHELRTPLTVIDGYTQLLKINPTLQNDATLKMALDGIMSGFERLQGIVSSMLDVARIESDALEMHREDTMLGIIIDRACNKFKDALAERNLTLIMENLEALPAISADPALLSKVFFNLVNNAIKYTPDGGRIMISWELISRNDKPDAVEVVVKDTGIGIDPNDLEVIFEKFFQSSRVGDIELHSSGRTKFKGGGPGLGLAIVKGIVLAHNGQIWADSPGYDDQNCPGSEFHVRLPLT